MVENQQSFNIPKHNFDIDGCDPGAEFFSKCFNMHFLFSDRFTLLWGVNKSCTSADSPLQGLYPNTMPRSPVCANLPHILLCRDCVWWDLKTRLKKTQNQMRADHADTLMSISKSQNVFLRPEKPHMDHT